MAAGIPMAKMPALLSFLEVRRAGKSEAVWEAASSSTRGSGWVPRGPASPTSDLASGAKRTLRRRGV